MSLFLEDFRHTCWVRRFQGMADNGRREDHGPPTPYPCRWQPVAKLVKSPEGKAVVAEGTLYTTARLTPKDLLWLPGSNPEDYKQSRRPLTSAEQTDLETGFFDHTEVTV